MVIELPELVYANESERVRVTLVDAPLTKSVPVSPSTMEENTRFALPVAFQMCEYLFFSPPINVIDPPETVNVDMLGESPDMLVTVVAGRLTEIAVLVTTRSSLAAFPDATKAHPFTIPDV